MSFGFGLSGRVCNGARLVCVALAAMLLALPALAQDKPKLPDAKTRDTIARKALTKVPPHIDASPLPRYKGDFVSLGADGLWNRPAEGTHFLTADTTGSQGPSADCSREAIVHYAEGGPIRLRARQARAALRRQDSYAGNAFENPLLGYARL